MASGIPDTTISVEPALLLELAREVTGTLDLQDVLDKSFKSLHRILDFGGGAIQLVEDGALVAAATDPPATIEALALRIPIGQGVSGRIAQSGEPIYIPDISSDDRVHRHGQVRGPEGAPVRSYFGVSLILHGEPIGVVQIDSPVPNAFSAGDRTRVLSFVPTIAAAVQNAQLFALEVESAQRLREAEQLKDDFLAIAWHELRTPLTTLTGFAATLVHQAKALDPDTIAECAGRIWRASLHLERLVTDLVDVARIEHESSPTATVATELRPVLLDSIAAARTGRQVALDVEDGVPAVRAEPARLKQVVVGLLSNAAKFSPQDSSIVVRAQQRVAGVAVSVTDRGEGIPSELRDRIFDRFYQVERPQTRAHGGLGVGLYLARKLCERMGARMEVDSVVGRGSTFTVVLNRA